MSECNLNVTFKQDINTSIKIIKTIYDFYNKNDMLLSEIKATMLCDFIKCKYLWK